MSRQPSPISDPIASSTTGSSTWRSSVPTLITQVWSPSRRRLSSTSGAAVNGSKSWAAMVGPGPRNVSVLTSYSTSSPACVFRSALTYGRRMSRSQPAARLEEAEQRLFARYGVTPRAFDVTLADPALRVRVLESGDGPPLLLVHGSGTSASTWAPLLPHLPRRRLLAVDLPGFGLSDAHDYSWRP